MNMTKRTYITKNNNNNKSKKSLQNTAREAAAALATTTNVYKMDLNAAPASSGFKAAKNAYENGNEQLRQMLMHECNLIYECQMCRSLFRSLEEFLKHKRSICKVLLNKQHKHTPKTAAAHTQTEHQMRSISTCTTPIPSIVELPAAAEASEDVTDAAVEQRKKMNFGQKYPELHGLLFPKETVTHASQSVAEETVTDVSQELIASNGLEVQTLQLTDSNAQQQLDSHQSVSGNLNKFYDMVKMEVHIPRCRFASTYVFQCPQCPRIFVQPSSATKHLMKAHNRPRLGLRMLREAILKRRIQLISDNCETNEKCENDCHCAYCKEVFKHNIDLSIHLLYCSVKNIVLQRRRVHLRHHSADYIRTAIEESKREHLDPTIPLDYSEFWPISKQKLTQAKKKLKEKEAKAKQKENLAEVAAQNKHQKKEIKTKLIKKKLTNEMKTETEKDKTLKRKKQIKNKKEAKEYQPSEEKLPQKENKKQTKLKEKLKEKRLKRKNMQNESSLPESHSSNSLRSLDSSENEYLSSNNATNSSTKYNPCRCKICNKKFDGLGNVRRHISMYHYHANRFGCKLCNYRAFRRYDIVNHLGFVHKMNEERELMAVQYVIQHEVEENLDVDVDIELLSDEKPTVVIKNAVGRPRKALSVEQTTTSSVKPKSSKSKDKDLVQKRPIRNRIKPLEKDFVYDEDTKQATPQARCLRKRQNGIVTPKTEVVEMKPATPPAALLKDGIMAEVKGTASRLLINLVASGLASAASAPELPSERPKMRPHVSDHNRDGMQAGRVIETVELEQARLKSTLLDDTFLAAKINQIKMYSASNSLHNFRVKPALSQKEQSQRSVTRNLLMKVGAENVERTANITSNENSNEAITTTTITEEENNFVDAVTEIASVKQEKLDLYELDTNWDDATPPKRLHLCSMKQEPHDIDDSGVWEN